MRKTAKDISRLTCSLNCKQAKWEGWGTNQIKTNNGCQRLCICLTALKRSRGKNKAHCFTREELLIKEREEDGTFVVLHWHPPLWPRLVGNQTWDSVFNREAGKKPWNSLGAVIPMCKRQGKAARAAGGTRWGNLSCAGRKGEGNLCPLAVFKKVKQLQFHFSERYYHKQLSKCVKIKQW